MSNYRAIILAAGRGSRMGDETALKPKCLTTLLGKTLLSWQQESIRKSGIEDITVARGYRSDMLTGDFKTVNNKRWSETNMVATLFCAEPSPKNTIISYSDIVYNPKHIEKLKETEGDIIITADKKWRSLWQLRFEDPLEDAETFKSDGDFLIEIGNKTEDYKDIEAQYMGLLKLTKKGWDEIYEVYSSFSDKEKDKMDMTSMLRELLKRNIIVKVVFIEGAWCEADNYSDILAYEKALSENKKWEHDWR